MKLHVHMRNEVNANSNATMAEPTNKMQMVSFPFIPVQSTQNRLLPFRPHPPGLLTSPPPPVQSPVARFAAQNRAQIRPGAMSLSQGLWISLRETGALPGS